MRNYEVDYTIYGEELQCIEIELDPNEAIIAEPGSFMMMNDGIRMETLFGDGSNSGFMDKLFTAGRRMLTGESLFMSVFTNISSEKRRVSFAAPYTGKLYRLICPILEKKLFARRIVFFALQKAYLSASSFRKN